MKLEFDNISHYYLTIQRSFFEMKKKQATLYKNPKIELIYIGYLKS